MRSAYGLHIAGKERDALQGGTLPVENPATGEVVTTVADASAEDVDAAVVRDALKRHTDAYGHGPDGEVFTTERGNALDYHNFRRMAWLPAVESAGLDEVTFHQLRHTYASLLIDAGEGLKIVQERLGHKDISETANTYAHLYPASEQRTRSAVDAALGDERVMNERRDSETE